MGGDMIKFIKDKVIKRDYTVYASYYNIYKGIEKLIECRNVLEIIKNNQTVYFSNKLYYNDPEALIIMMNPGASYPSSTNYLPHIVQLNTLNEDVLNNVMITAEPDRAQCQIMRLMKLNNWERIRVINLSDIRTGNSDDFINKMKIFEEKHLTDVHSIFSDKRSEERKLAFNISKDAPIILGWGIDNSLIILTSRYMRHIPMEKVKGVPANLYYHASPQKQEDKEKWLENIMRVL